MEMMIVRGRRELLTLNSYFLSKQYLLKNIYQCLLHYSINRVCSICINHCDAWQDDAVNRSQVTFEGKCPYITADCCYAMLSSLYFKILQLKSDLMTGGNASSLDISWCRRNAWCKQYFKDK